MIIKVCGMRDRQNIIDVAALGVDMIGFNFWPQSKRYVSMINSGAGIIPDFSSERLGQLSKHVRGKTGEERQEMGTVKPLRVGLFVDEMPQSIITRIYNYNLDYVQLHGSEEPVMLENLKHSLIPDIAPNIKVIKAFGIAAREDLEQVAAYEDIADMFVFDYKSPGKGGSGQHFDWSVLDAYKGHTPFLLSGGIGPDDIEAISHLRHPMMAGVDVNSRFETAPAMKDVALLRTFVNEIRKLPSDNRNHNE